MCGYVKIMLRHQTAVVSPDSQFAQAVGWFAQTELHTQRIIDHDIGIFYVVLFHNVHNVVFYTFLF